MKSICKLCLEEKELLESHSIPRSYFKRLKKNDSQLIIFQKVVNQNEKMLILKSHFYASNVSSLSAMSTNRMEQDC